MKLSYHLTLPMPTPMPMLVPVPVRYLFFLCPGNPEAVVQEMGVI